MENGLEQPRLKSTGVGDGNDIIPCSNKCQTTEGKMPAIDPVTLINMSMEERQEVAKKLVQFQMNSMGGGGHPAFPMPMLSGGKLQQYGDGKVGYVMDIHAAIDCMGYSNIQEMIAKDPSSVHSKGKSFFFHTPTPVSDVYACDAALIGIRASHWRWRIFRRPSIMLPSNNQNGIGNC